MRAAPQYLASGAVDGSIRDDFSLSVLDDGVVGVVTADVLPWEQRNDARSPSGSCAPTPTRP